MGIPKEPTVGGGGTVLPMSRKGTCGNTLTAAQRLPKLHSGAEGSLQSSQAAPS